MGIIHL